ncbi:MAG: multidrug effflux MFS transporter, partial [Parvibaculaceae bacterium]
LSTDMYLASLPAIGRHFATDAGQVQLTLSLFLAGFAVGQIVYGPISDRLGRRPVLFGGLALFVLASIGCGLSLSIGMLIGARFLQALGACAAVVLARAIVRDLYSGEDAARILSFMGALMGLVPAVAPILGGFLQTAFDWHASFAVTAGIGILLLIGCYLALPETLDPARRAQAASIRGMPGDFYTIARHRLFRRYTAAVCLGYGGLFAFISGSSFVLQGYYGLNEVQFGAAFASCVVGYISGTLIGARVTRRLGIARTVDAGTMVMAAGGLAMIAAIQMQPPHILHLLIPMSLYLVGIGMTLPVSMAGAMQPFPERAGTASSLLGFTQMTFAALVGVAVGHMVETWPTALAWTIGVMGVLNLVLTLLYRGRSGAAT